MSYDLPAMAPGTDIDTDLVVLRRSDLFQLLGKWGLPPWHDVDGRLLGERIDCAPLAAEMIADVERVIL